MYCPFSFLNMYKKTIKIHLKYNGVDFMFIKKEKYNLLEKQILKLNDTLQKNNIQELSYILGNKKEMIKRNLISGIFRGIGIGIGVTVITAILVFIMQRIVTLNIPVIGEYISDIVEIVEKSR